MIGLAAKLTATVGVAFAMENACITSAAGCQVVSSPACDAVMVQLPAPVMCTVLPAIEQLPLAPKLTSKPELAVADTVKSESP